MEDGTGYSEIVGTFSWGSYAFSTSFLAPFKLPKLMALSESNLSKKKTAFLDSSAGFSCSFSVLVEWQIEFVSKSEEEDDCAQ